MSEDLKLFAGQSKLDSGRLDHLRYSGIVDFDALYNTVITWFKKRGYDFYEKLYKDKPPELELEWVATRKLDDFYKYKIEMYFHIFDIENVESIKDGVKKKMIKCRFWVRFEPILVLDYQNRWEKNAFTKTLWKIYRNHVIRKEWELLYADPLWYITYKLQNVMKKQLGMETSGGAY